MHIAHFSKRLHCAFALFPPHPSPLRPIPVAPPISLSFPSLSSHRHVSCEDKVGAGLVRWRRRYVAQRAFIADLQVLRGRIFARALSHVLFRVLVACQTASLSLWQHLF